MLPAFFEHAIIVATNFNGEAMPLAALPSGCAIWWTQILIMRAETRDELGQWMVTNHFAS